MTHEERQIRELLKGAGAKFERKTGRGGEMWRLPNGAAFFMSTSSGDYRAQKNNLADLRRVLAKVEPETIVAAANAPAIAAIKKHEAPAPAIVAVVTPPPPKEEEQPMGVIQLKTPPPKKEESAAGTRWTDAQDRELVECYDANMSVEEIVKYMQDVRPGVTAPAVQQRASALRQRLRALGQPRPLAQLPPAVNTSPPPVAAPAPPAAPTPEGVMVRVTFEAGDKRRVVYVDQATAQEMMNAAARLA